MLVFLNVLFYNNFRMDSSSWALLFEMMRTLNNLSFILTSRPFSLPYPPDYIHLMRFPQFKKITLELMNRNDTLKLTLSKLKVSSIPLFLQALLYEKAKGFANLSYKLFILRSSFIFARSVKKAA